MKIAVKFMSVAVQVNVRALSLCLFVVVLVFCELFAYVAGLIIWK